MPANRVESIGGYAYQIKPGSNEPASPYVSNKDS